MSPVSRGSRQADRDERQHVSPGLPQGIRHAGRQGGAVLQRAAVARAVLRAARRHDRGGRQVGHLGRPQLGGADHQRRRVPEHHPRHPQHEVEDDLRLHRQGSGRRVRRHQLCWHSENRLLADGVRPVLQKSPVDINAVALRHGSYAWMFQRWTIMCCIISVPRDAAAWAAEKGKLYVMGGSLGTLSGYTASTEVYDPATDTWHTGTSLTSTRASHCAVGDGEGHIVVTGGYGALEVVQRLDLATGRWQRLADLQPVRAQHGCAAVELGGRRGVIVVGGDSGGTRLSDVRFLALDSAAPHKEEWLKIADLNIARWGRPSVGIIGGRVTGNTRHHSSDQLLISVSFQSLVDGTG